MFYEEKNGFVLYNIFVALPFYVSNNTILANSFYD